ncbi:MAG: CarD family transcriptional regulator, partial [Eubacterium sp.]
HDVHGIGIYRGIEQMTITGITKDLMVIEYAGEAKLYIPVEQMDTVQVYIGMGEKKPKINQMGNPDWQKAKSRAKKAVEDMADELIDLYSKRRMLKGYAFGPDTTWQKEFEDDFPYVETDDQLRCVEEIKMDMESDIPMDRLLCGDVGYGKTEVALRAAFKAMMEGKQVALLVPTTILAQQHYNTVLKRFKKYPISAEVISRFRTPVQQKNILKDLAMGKIDMIIGTHRLLSQDVHFKDLGLLIVDEEQRFGVRSKEKIKQIRENVDVLTLSATPIPRTLHMSMTGVRDMSVIEEPPAGRRPVQTYVMPYNPLIIQDAINRELARNGQVYFVHNRVYDIDEVALTIQSLVKDARVVVAHGRMSGSELEDIMVDFLNHEFDILVTTTIVESGLDVKNAN